MSARKRMWPIIGLVWFLGIVIAGVVLAFMRHTPPVTTATLGGRTYRLTVSPEADDSTAQNSPNANRNANATYHYVQPAYDAALQQKGLGGLQSIPNNGGMIFWYSEEARRCFWMKDMRFSLDIIWANSAKRVVRVEHDVAPNTYPQQFCADSAQYVIELNAGEAIKSGITGGQTLSF